jgi:putative DNA methylase
VSEEFPTEDDQEKERLRLVALISELVQWENITNEEVLNRAREEIRRSWNRGCIDNPTLVAGPVVSSSGW